ncbi:MAG: NAD(+) synthase [Anaerococcus sp.]|nr:NAD(+) synthase [Anaerococcus sp.]
MYKNLKILGENFNIELGDIAKNTESIKKIMTRSGDEGVDLICLPELSLSGASLYDLYTEEVLIERSRQAIRDLVDFSKNFNFILGLGSVIKSGRDLYNAYLLIKSGEILEIYIKENLKPYEKMIFSNNPPDYISLDGVDIPVNKGEALDIEGLRLGVSIGEDESMPIAKSLIFKKNGARLILNPHAFERFTLSEKKLQEDITYLSKDIIYLSVGPGEGESSTDFAYSDLCTIGSNGDINSCDRQRVVATCPIDIEGENSLTSKNLSEVTRFPYLPKDEDRDEYVKDVFEIGARGLLTRCKKVGTYELYLGLSGGLDSTMSLLLIAYAYHKEGIDFDKIHLITMPAFATSKKTKTNAYRLSEALGLDLREIDISESVRSHLRDIGHDLESQDVTYENAQGRERTQVLFDLANQGSGLVIGTGDLSEAMQGFATYNGDHMSSYSTNASLTKTHLRYIISYVAEKTENEELREVLEDILATPISPELTSEKEGEISQKTEDIIGPYELIDFFIYHHLANKLAQREIRDLAQVAFADSYDRKTIDKWLRSYYKRFSQSQFKRSASVDSVTITGLSYSPRTGYKIPSDMGSGIYLEEL